MSLPDRLTPSLRAWLDEGTRPLSVDVRASVVEALPTLRQDRPFGLSWRVTDPDVAKVRRRAFRLFALAAITLAALLAVVAALAVVGQSPPTARRFTPGSIAFTRNSELFVAAPDGSEPVAIGATDPDVVPRLRVLARQGVPCLHRRQPRPRHAHRVDRRGR